MKLMIGLLAAAILGTGGFAFAGGVDDAQPARTVTLSSGTTSAGTTTTGTTTTGTTAATTTPAADDIVIGGSAPAARAATGGVDISGPCDEAEHATDPRCRGATGDDGDDDNSGHGSDDDSDDDDHDDRSGSNSGSSHGSGDDDDN